MKRHVCIHGHFYQPPRENPWLEAIENQDSAYPYADWNERITAECYAPNTATRILDDKRRIVDIVNNYSKISFNFGPTLLSWLQKEEPNVYQLILDADKQGQKNFGGHGPAIAQVYNHMILPLANKADKTTQVIWGVKDFEYRFGRKPEGMWLAETAVNTETLEVLVEQGITFTILSPYQAQSVRQVGSKDWQSLEHGIDPKQAYVCNLPSGKSIALFFYDGPISQELAFGDLLKDGARFAHRLVDTFVDDVDGPQLVHVSNDGETFGHHHKFGNMALAYALDFIESQDMAELTIYGQYLELYPPTIEVKILENTAWSCSHGVGRWQEDCGCSIAGKHGWDQKWRRGLRDAMDWLRDELCVVYERQSAELVNNPWDLRNAFIDFILTRDEKCFKAMVMPFAKKPLEEDQISQLLRLLEMQRQAMLMYTSCGWFFDDVSGIEPTQIMQYAARAIQLAAEVGGPQLEAGYLKHLAKAKNNSEEFKTAADVYQQVVNPSVIDLIDVGAHFAISSVFEDFPHVAHIYCYTVDTLQFEKFESAKYKLVIGKSLVRSDITLSVQMIEFAVLFSGDHNLSIGVQEHLNLKSYNEMIVQLGEAFNRKHFHAVKHLITHFFGKNKYSLWDLFKNERGKALDRIFEKTLDEIEMHFREINERYYSLMHIKKDIRTPLPKALSMIAEFVLNRDLYEILENEDLDIEHLERVVFEIKRWSFMRDKEKISVIATKRITSLMQRVAERPEDLEVIKTAVLAIKILKVLLLNLELWKAQDLFFAVRRRVYDKMTKKKDNHSKLWLSFFRDLEGVLEVEIA